MLIFSPFASVRPSRKEKKRRVAWGAEVNFCRLSSAAMGVARSELPIFFLPPRLSLPAQSFLGPTSCIFLADKKGGGLLCRSVRPLKREDMSARGPKKRNFFATFVARGEERDLSRYTAEDEKKVRPGFWALGLLDVVQFRAQAWAAEAKKGTKRRRSTSN